MHGNLHFSKSTALKKLNTTGELLEKNGSIPSISLYELIHPGIQVPFMISLMSLIIF
jgi:hypothetical protein